MKPKKRGRRPERARLPQLHIEVKSGRPIDYKDLDLIEKCVDSQGQILSRRRTGLNSQRQRELKTAIKRARHLGLLPFVR